MSAHLADRARAMIETLEVCAQDYAKIGEDIHHASVAAVNRAVVNQAPRKTHAKRRKPQLEDRICQRPDDAAGAATVFYSLTDDEDDATRLAVDHVATQTELCFDDHNKCCVLGCSVLIEIEAGLAMLAQERMQAHEVCSRLADELTVTCSSVDYVEASLLSEVCSGEPTDCDLGGQATLRVHSAFEGFHLSAMAFLEV